MHKLFVKILVLVAVFTTTTGTYAADGGLPQFDFSLYSKQLFWLFATFFLTFIFISYFVIPKIRTVISFRKSKIVVNIEKVENIKREVQGINNKIHKEKKDHHEKVTLLSDKYKKDFNKFKQNELSLLTEYSATEKQKLDVDLKEFYTLHQKSKDASLREIIDVILNDKLGLDVDKNSINSKVEKFIRS